MKRKKRQCLLFWRRLHLHSIIKVERCKTVKGISRTEAAGFVLAFLITVLGTCSGLWSHVAGIIMINPKCSFSPAPLSFSSICPSWSDRCLNASADVYERNLAMLGLLKSCANTLSLCSLILSPFCNSLGLTGVGFPSSQLVNYC